MKNVLIVDDEKSLLLTMQAGFAAYKDNFTVLTAENGKAAVTILESNPIDLVVTDLKMPEMDGFELLLHMHANFPNIPAIVMTAFGTPQIEAQLKKTGMLRLLEKPVDFDELTQAILKCLDERVKGGTLTGISLPSFLQLIEMEQNTCLMEVSAPSTGEQGLLYFNEGILYDAIFQDFKEEEAVYAMLVLDDVKISFKTLPDKRFKKKINTNLMTLLMEGIRRKDELEKDREEESIPSAESVQEKAESTVEAAEAAPQKTADSDEASKGELSMSEVFEVLEKLKVVGGFMAAGAFSPNGEMVAEVNSAGVNLAELGAIANDVLLKAQKATEMMNVGRGQVVHVEAPKAHVICRCLNEATDFAATSSGRAHVHMVMILNREDGNVALGKMKMEGIIQELAEHFR